MWWKRKRQIAWATETVPIEQVARTLTLLESELAPAGKPILVYIDQTRVLVAWRYYVE